jgi:hypothetical protein
MKKVYFVFLFWFYYVASALGQDVMNITTSPSGCASYTGMISLSLINPTSPTYYDKPYFGY